jgi:hypothetical protein
MRTLLLLAALTAQSKDKDPVSTKEAMRRVQILVGEWTVTWQVDDSTEFWEEKHDWNFKIDKDEFALQLTVKDAKKFKDATLGYDLKKKVYRFDATRADDKKVSYEGTLKGGMELTLTQVVEEGAEAERLNLTLLRANRLLMNIEKRGAGAKTFLATHTVQFRNNNMAFVKGDGGPKCVVTGGAGKIEVKHDGKTYTVC